MVDAWYTRALAWIGLGSARLLTDNAPSEAARASAEQAAHNAGADFAGYPAAAGYDPAAAAATRGRFTWVYATISRKGTDLARLPWVAQAGSRGRRGRMLDRHPILLLVEGPNTATPAHQFWTQLHLDRETTGSAYARKVRKGGRPDGLWISLLRLAPQSVRVVAGSHGLPVAFEFSHGGSTEVIPANDMLHFTSPSWQDDTTALSGEGVIEPMARDLRTDWALQERMRKAADQGRPSGILTPDSKDGAAGFTPSNVTAFREELGQIFRSASGGIAILGRPVVHTALDYSPDELQTVEQRKFIREGVLGAVGVPPVRVGLETANYATAQQQSETYWGDELQGFSATFDDVITMHARREFGPPDLYVYRSFADVPALMGARESAIRRASQHILNGADPAKAYEAEGLDPLDFAAPVVVAPAATDPKPRTATKPAADPPAEDTKRGLRVVGADDWWPDEQQVQRRDLGGL